MVGDMLVDNEMSIITLSIIKIYSVNREDRALSGTNYTQIALLGAYGPI